jgi:hypothetical protein
MVTTSSLPKLGRRYYDGKLSDGGHSVIGATDRDSGTS